MSDMTTILIGNGLGMAIDSEAFTLQSGFKDALKKLQEEDLDAFKLIEKIIKNQDIKYDVLDSNLEKKLFDFQETLFQLDEIMKLISVIPEKFRYDKDLLGDLGLLDVQHKNLNHSYSYFCFLVANYFFDQSCNITNTKFINFIKNLGKYIVEKGRGNANLLTLNYDALLYKYLIGADIFTNGMNELIKNIFVADYNKTFLVDGFNIDSSGFKSDNLEPFFNNKFGYYFHLHGSPLYYIQPRNQLTNLYNKNKFYEYLPPYTYSETRNHFILASPSHKTKLIEQSYILNIYWQHCLKILKQSKTLYLIGYSGNDSHVNDLINNNFTGDIVVVEWSGEGSKKERTEYWENLYHNKIIKYKPKKSILDYDFKNE